jgi:Ca-activated chloride channel family protein
MRWAMPRRALLLAAAGLLLTGASASVHRHVEAGNRALAAGDAKGAGAHYDAALAERPDDPALRYNRGTAHLAAGDLDAAARDLGAVAGQAEGTLQARAAYNLGNALLERAERAGHMEQGGGDPRKDLTAAIGAYREAVAANPDDADARRNLQIAAARLRALPQPPPRQQSGGGPQDRQQPSGGKDQNQPKAGGQPNPGSQDSDGQSRAGQQQDGKPDAGQQAGGEKGNRQQPRNAQGQDEKGDGDRDRQTAEASHNGQDEQTGRKGQGGQEDQASDTPSANASGDATAQAGEAVPRDVARLLSSLRRREAATMREALRRSLGEPEPVEKDW